MADTVSKLYAEIGFKVNKDGLKKAQSLLKDMANQMSAINNATKEAAKQYGIFSKEKSKQAIADAKLAVENEKAENQRNKRRLDNKKFEHKQLMDLAKFEFQVEKYNASEKQKIERQQSREAEKAAKNQKKRLKELLSGFRSFAVGLRNTFLSLAGLGTAGAIVGMKQSLDRSIPTRDFMMTTGVSLPELQSVMQRMVNTGSGMTQQQIMSDIQKVSQNLQDIALGGGGIVPYKLAGIAASGNVMDVLKATEQSVKGLNNATALNLTRRMGLSDDWLASWRYRQRYGGTQLQVNAEQQNEIIETQLALRQLKFAFKNLSDFLVVAISPVIQRMADTIRDWLQSISTWIDEHPNTIKELLDDLHKLGEGIKTAFKLIVATCEWIVDKIGSIIKAPKQVWENSEIGKLIKKNSSSGMSPINPAFEDELLNWGNDNVKAFNQRPTSRTANINSDDHSNTTINFNGYNEEQMVEKVEDVIESKQKSRTLGDRVSDISQLWVVGHSANASVGR
jgi:hypothetical protein